MKRSLLAATPFTLAVPVLFGAGFLLAGYPAEPVPAVLGAVGWVVALALRAPVALAALRLLGEERRVQRAVVLSSGPLEEGVRVALVLLIGRDVGTALWIGLGWAAIEVVYSIVNGFVVAQLAERDDEQARQARAMLPEQALSSSAPWWGVVERAFATALHVGFTLIVAAAPPAAVLTAIVHSGTNAGFVALLRRHSTALVMAGALLLGVATMMVGLLMHEPRI